MERNYSSCRSPVIGEFQVKISLPLSQVVVRRTWTHLVATAARAFMESTDYPKSKMDGRTAGGHVRGHYHHYYYYYYIIIIVIIVVVIIVVVVVILIISTRLWEIIITSTH